MTGSARWMRALVAGSVLAALLFVAVLPRLPRLPGVPGTCGFHALTGLPCALCGGTRSVSALLHGDWQRAVHLNPMAIPLVAGAVVSALVLGIEALIGRPLAPWAAWSRRLPLFLSLALVVIAVWWLPFLVHAVRQPNPELIDLRNPIARRMHEWLRDKKP